MLSNQLVASISIGCDAINDVVADRKADRKRVVNVAGGNFKESQTRVRQNPTDLP